MIRVPDGATVDEAIDWYKGIGCLVLAINQPEGQPVDWARLLFGNAEFMITAGGAKGSGTSVVLYFYTDDLDAEHRALKDRGIPAKIDTAFHGMREISITDPNGFSLVIAQRVAGQPSSIRSVDDTDGLTGLPTKRLFDATLADTVDDGAGVFSVAFLDIDRFADVNAASGHTAGDSLLTVLAEIFTRASAANGSQIFRIGGDEFSVIMPATEKETAFLALESARSEFEQATSLADVKPHPTISIGIATYPDDGSTPQEIVRKADDALFRAKSAGRNRVALAREEKKIPKTSHYTQGQLDRLTALSEKQGVGEAELIREAMDILLKQYTS